MTATVTGCRPRGHDAWGDGVGSLADGDGDPSGEGDGDGDGLTLEWGVLPRPGVGLACVALGLGVGVGDGCEVAGDVVCCVDAGVPAFVEIGRNSR
jgi:hypothetical protein